MHYKMQLFVRCGLPVGTLAVDCSLSDTVAKIKDSLSLRYAQLGPCRFMRLQYAGVSLPDERVLSDVCGLGPDATLQLSYRLRGGGGDGGSTGAESRSCYLEMYLGKKADKVNPEEERLAKWTRCHLSGEPLMPPCVVDDLGNLYNKDALIQRLLDKTLPSSLAHITGLKSVTELKLHPSKHNVGTSNTGTSNAKAAASQTSFQPSNDSDFCCPVTGVAFNGRYKFLVLRPSGHVVSEKALKEVPAVVEDLAGKKVSELESIPVNPTGEHLEHLRARVAARLAGKGASKRDKKRSAEAVAVTGAVSTSITTTTTNGNVISGGGMGDAGAQTAAAAKRLKIPTGATKEVYSSIFSNSKAGASEKETFCCRALSARGMNLT